MLKTKKELETLKNKYDRLQEKLKESQVENEALQERLDKITRGERCISEYCASCKHSVDAGRYVYKTIGGREIFLGGGARVCALDATCPGYEQEEWQCTE